jgi:hypothetical protein
MDTGFDGRPLYNVYINGQNATVNEMLLDEGQDISIRRVAFYFKGAPYTKYVYYEGQTPIGYVFGNRASEGYVFDTKQLVFSYYGVLQAPAFNDLTSNNAIDLIKIKCIDTEEVEVIDDPEILHNLNFWGKPITIITTCVTNLG